MSYSVLNTKKILDVVKYRWVWLSLSFILLFPGILAMFWSMYKYPNHSPLLVGIDFTGGTIVQYAVDKKVSTDDVAKIRGKLYDKGIDSPVIQVLSTNEAGSNSEIKDIISIKTQAEAETSDNAEADSMHAQIIDNITEAVTAYYPNAALEQESFVGPVLGKQLSCFAGNSYLPYDEVSF